eukprot:CAMPEP_0201176350 /NCGR_PEP_ID=MMETSP0851-20130426/104685_1 /ASSEMBLY_ACC=CAM_ASM_000631 /TAXON_ID=183588 /ORGANISM="Pseudo-nitzschia fraudulenta, Strain WWA7" /LENGTH=213 /DNA_ID=CAMNT_0047459715 /DNA_START=64 /DNA_END=708 /DNA_ORIENTATION=+
MSGRGSNNSSTRYKDNHRGQQHPDDVESYRQQNRREDRRYREHEDGGSSSRDDRGRRDRHAPRTMNNNDRKNPISNSRKDDDDRKEQLALDRQRRMARLRQEIKEEDETMAKLDQQQESKAGGNSEGDAKNQQQGQPQEAIIEIRPEELEGLDEEEQMRRLLGFNGFGSTKGEAVEDNQSTAARGGAAKNKARKYRQYMNRKNGFNRPLEKMN